MKEILGYNLLTLFENESFDFPEYAVAGRTYKNEMYEVWLVSEDVYENMCKMTEEEFERLTDDETWWRGSDGSILKNRERGLINVNGKDMIGWVEKPYGGSVCHGLSYQSLTEYLCEFLGVSTEKNVCACAMDLAKYNNMTMGELFEKYEGKMIYE